MVNTLWRDKKKYLNLFHTKNITKFSKLTWTIEDFDGSIHASGFSLKPASIILVGGFFLSNICQWSTSLLLNSESSFLEYPDPTYRIIKQLNDNQSLLSPHFWMKVQGYC